MDVSSIFSGSRTPNSKDVKAAPNTESETHIKSAPSPMQRGGILRKVFNGLRHSFALRRFTLTPEPAVSNQDSAPQIPNSAGSLQLETNFAAEETLTTKPEEPPPQVVQPSASIQHSSDIELPQAPDVTASDRAMAEAPAASQQTGIIEATACIAVNQQAQAHQDQDCQLSGDGAAAAAEADTAHAATAGAVPRTRSGAKRARDVQQQSSPAKMVKLDTDSLAAEVGQQLSGALVNSHTAHGHERRSGTACAVEAAATTLKPEDGAGMSGSESEELPSWMLPGMRQVLKVYGVSTHGWANPTV